MQLRHDQVPERRCNKCSTLYRGLEVQAMFTNQRRAARTQTVNTICNACLQDRRDARKAADPFTAKAQWARRSHARRLGIRVADLADLHGWDIARIAHDLRRHWENGCQYCGRAFQSMRNGMADMTLDIIDPAKPPGYLTNVHIACVTCNREKGANAPELFEAKKHAWQRYERGKARRPVQLALLWETE